jgi:hypothetical protein
MESIPELTVLLYANPVTASHHNQAPMDEIKRHEPQDAMAPVPVADDGGGGEGRGGAELEAAGGGGGAAASAAVKEQVRDDDATRWTGGGAIAGPQVDDEDEDDGSSQDSDDGSGRIGRRRRGKGSSFIPWRTPWPTCRMVPPRVPRMRTLSTPRSSDGWRRTTTTTPSGGS